MYGHIPQYLDAEKQRLRAERGEQNARRWRLVAYVVLALFALQTVRLTVMVVDARPVAERLTNERAARAAAEEKFRVCLAANHGLVDALREFDSVVKEQQLVIQESLDLARRCDARPATWALRIPAVSEVRW